MNICGINKLTLLDYPQHTACTLFVGGCNMRCPFCHNSGLVYNTEVAVDVQDVMSFLAKRKNILEGVCISGGEPTLHNDLPDLIKEIRSIGYKIKLDTNGSNPDMLSLLVNHKLVDYVAMDIKNSLAKYPTTVGVSGYDTARIQTSVDILLQGETDYEFRTTVVIPLHDEQSFVEMGKLIKGAKQYYLQPFELNPHNIVGCGLSTPSAQQLQQFADIMRNTIDNVYIRAQ